MFPAKQKLKVKHSYTPLLGSDSLGSSNTYGELYRSNKDKIRSIPGSFNCKDDPQLSPGAETSGFSSYELLDYVLAPGANWAGSEIGEFHLVVKNPGIILLYLEGTFETGLNQIEKKFTKFQPAEDLLVEFLTFKKEIINIFRFGFVAEIDGPAHLREAPNGPKVGQIPNKAKVKVLAGTKDWLQIQTQKGEIGWTHFQNIAHVPTTLPACANWNPKPSL